MAMHTGLYVCSKHLSVDWFGNKAWCNRGFTNKRLLKDEVMPTVLDMTAATSQHVNWYGDTNVYGLDGIDLLWMLSTYEPHTVTRCAAVSMQDMTLLHQSTFSNAVADLDRWCWGGGGTLILLAPVCSKHWAKLLKRWASNDIGYTISRSQSVCTVKKSECQQITYLLLLFV